MLHIEITYEREGKYRLLFIYFFFVYIPAHFFIFFPFLFSLRNVNFGCIMSLAALAQERFWENKAQCEDAEKAYYMRLSGAKAKVSFFELIF